MDFFGILYDMKNGKKVPYSKSYFDTLFAENLAGVTTLTGTLPLTFTTSETALRSWTLHGAHMRHTIEYPPMMDYPAYIYAGAAGAADTWTIYGNNNIGKNLFDKDAKDTNNGYVESARLRPDGTINTAATELWISEFIPVLPDIEYTLCDIVATSNYGLCFYDIQKNYISGLAYSVSDHGNLSFTTPNTALFLRLTVKPDYDTMLVEGSTAPDHYIPYQIGVGKPTNNLLEINETTATDNGVTFTVDKSTGTIKTSGTATGGSAIFKIYIDSSLYGNFRFAGCANTGTSSTFYIEAYDETTGAKCKAWDGIANSVNCYNTEQRRQFQIPENHICCLRIIFARNVNADGYVFMPMIIDDETTQDTLIPYGYQVPITVSQTGQTDKNYEIFVGSAPLTEGQSVSDTQPIEFFEGEQTIDIPLTNKPRLDLTVFDYYGIASRVNSGYQVKLKVTHNGSTNIVNIPVPNSMDEGDTVTDINPIPTEIGENIISLNWDTYPTTTMTIKYKE